MFTLQNNKWAKSGNEADRHEGKVIGIDMGGKASNFAVCVSTYGEIDRFGGAELEEICHNMLTDESVKRGLDIYFLHHAEKMVLKWNAAGVTNIFVGCCGGDYLKVVHDNENNELFKAGAHRRFISSLRDVCKEVGIRIDAKFNEYYTSQACSLTNDYIPANKAEAEAYSFGGNRVGGLYITKTRLMLDADVNAAANIVRLGGYDVVIPIGCDFRNEIRSMV